MNSKKAVLINKNAFSKSQDELQQNSKKKIELIGVQRRIKTIRRKTKKRTAGSKLPCAEAQRIENSERSSGL